MKRIERIQRTCKQCGKVFAAEQWLVASGGGIYCSVECRGMARRQTLDERFWKRVQKGDGCWEWQGAVHPSGYGVLFSYERGLAHPTPHRAHRLSWEIHVGPIPEGIFVCHRCDNRRCVRPDHLFLGTNTDNMRDASEKKRLVGNRSNHHLGSARPNAKITETDVVEMRRLSREGITGKELSARFGINRGTVSEILSGKLWKHVPMG